MSEQTGRVRCVSASQRRQDRRIQFEKDLRILRSATPTTQLVTGEVRDLSANGIGLTMTTALEAGETLLIEIRFPGCLCMNVAADVKSLKEVEPGKFHVGCQLRQRITSSKMEMICRLIQELAQKKEVAEKKEIAVA